MQKSVAGARTEDRGRREVQGRRFRERGSRTVRQSDEEDEKEGQYRGLITDDRLLVTDHGPGEAKGRRSNGYVLGEGVAFWDRKVVGEESLHVHLNGLVHVAFRLRASSPSGDAARKVGRVGGVVCPSLFDDDEKATHAQSFSFRPACLRMLFHVPGARS